MSNNRLTGQPKINIVIKVNSTWIAIQSRFPEVSIDILRHACYIIERQYDSQAQLCKQLLKQSKPHG